MNERLRPLVVLLALLGPGMAWAEKPAAARGGSSLPDSVRRVERQAGGEAIHVESMQRDGHDVVRIKVLTPNGRVRVVQEDPQAPAPRAGSRQDARDRTDRNDGGKPGDEGSEPT
jgi:hypothetical protein